MTVSINRKALSVVVHVSANDTVVVAGNDSVSNIAAPGEIVTEAYVKQVWYGSPSGNAAYWMVKRGANTLLVLDSTGWTDYAGNGSMLKQDPTANLVLQLVGTGNGYVMVELQKVVNNHTSEY